MSSVGADSSPACLSQPLVSQPLTRAGVDGTALAEVHALLAALSSISQADLRPPPEQSVVGSVYGDECGASLRGDAGDAVRGEPVASALDNLETIEKRAVRVCGSNAAAHGATAAPARPPHDPFNPVAPLRVPPTIVFTAFKFACDVRRRDTSSPSSSTMTARSHPLWTIRTPPCSPRKRAPQCVR